MPWPIATIIVLGCPLMSAGEEAYLLVKGAPRLAHLRQADLIALAKPNPLARLVCISSGIGLYDVRLQQPGEQGDQGVSVAALILEWHGRLVAEGGHVRYLDGDRLALIPENLAAGVNAEEGAHAL